MPRLSARLAMIHSLLLEGDDVWDLCCDHGFLGEAALRSGLHERVHFVDEAPHLVERLRQRLGMDPAARFHAKGGEHLDEPVRGTVVIAGVGARTIRRILEAWLTDDRLQATRMILGPHKNEEVLREWLHGTFAERGWAPPSSRIVVEKGRRRELLVIDRENGNSFAPLRSAGIRP